MPDWSASLVPLRSLVPPTPDEAAFRRWYMRMAQRWDLSPDPDAPDQFYDYRAAWRAGATPDPTGHWPSDFKKAGHPNMVVGGFNVQTGERVPGTPLAKSVEELIQQGWDPATARQLWSTVQTAAPPRPR
jgi:hypothetical protein